MRRDVMRFVLNKMADVEEAPRVSVSFYVVNVIFKSFLSGLERKCKNSDQPWFVSLYPRHLCRRVYSFRFSVRPFVRSYVS